MGIIWIALERVIITCSLVGSHYSLCSIDTVTFLALCIIAFLLTKLEIYSVGTLIHLKILHGCVSLMAHHLNSKENVSSELHGHEFLHTLELLLV